MINNKFDYDEYALRVYERSFDKAFDFLNKSHQSKNEITSSIESVAQSFFRAEMRSFNNGMAYSLISQRLKENIYISDRLENIPTFFWYTEESEGELNKGIKSLVGKIVDTLFENIENKESFSKFASEVLESIHTLDKTMKNVNLPRFISQDLMFMLKHDFMHTVGNMVRNGLKDKTKIPAYDEQEVKKIFFQNMKNVDVKVLDYTSDVLKVLKDELEKTKDKKLKA